MSGRGLRYTLGIVWCRVVPAWCFRYRCMEIVRLGKSSADGEPNDQKTADSYEARKVETAEELERVQRATLYNGASSQESSSHLNDAAGTDRSSQSESESESSSQIVGGVWIAMQSFIERDLHLQIDLAEHQRWLFAARMMPEERSRGAYSVLLRKLLSAETTSDSTDERGADAGEVTQVWAAINPANHRSVRAHARYQITTAGRIHLIRIGPLAVAWQGRSSAECAVTICPKWTWHGTKSPIRMTVSSVTGLSDSTANSA